METNVQTNAEETVTVTIIEDLALEEEIQEAENIIVASKHLKHSLIVYKQSAVNYRK